MQVFCCGFFIREKAMLQEGKKGGKVCLKAGIPMPLQMNRFRFFKGDSGVVVFVDIDGSAGDKP